MPVQQRLEADDEGSERRQLRVEPADMLRCEEPAVLRRVDRDVHVYMYVSMCPCVHVYVCMCMCICTCGVWIEMSMCKTALVVAFDAAPPFVIRDPNKRSAAAAAPTPPTATDSVAVRPPASSGVWSARGLGPTPLPPWSPGPSAPWPPWPLSLGKPAASSASAAFSLSALSSSAAFCAASRTIVGASAVIAMTGTADRLIEAVRMPGMAVSK